MGRVLYIFTFLALVPITVAAEHQAGTEQRRPQTPTANVAFLDADGEFSIREVALPLMKDRLESELFSFEPAPEILKKHGSFKLDPDSEDFIWPHLYYHLDQQIKKFNRLLEQAGCRPLKGIKIRVHRAKPGDQPHAMADATQIDIYYVAGGFDPSILAHELGHAAHFSCVGQLEGLTPEGEAPDLRTYMEWHGISEGVANLLGALVTEQPRIARQARKQLGYDVAQQGLHYPDRLPSGKDRLEAQVQSEQYRKLYPKTVADNRADLAGEANSDWLEAPDPYLASAVFTAPLWRASQKFGSEKVAKLVLDSTPAANRIVGYPAFASALVASAKEEALRTFLEEEFKAAGLIE